VFGNGQFILWGTLAKKVLNSPSNHFSHVSKIQTHWYEERQPLHWEDTRGGSAYKQRQVTFPIEPLLDSLKDSNVFVREQAAWALGEIGDPQALSALEKIARSDKKGLLFPSEAAKKAREAVEKIRRRNKAN